MIKKEIEDAGIRLDKVPPDITVKRHERGGVTIQKSIKKRCNRLNFHFSRMLPSFGKRVQK